MAKRNLYLTNTPVEEALEKYQAALGSTLGKRSETIPVAQAAGRVTAHSVYARYNSPLYNSAAMDGIAVVAKTTVGAKETKPLTLAPGEYVDVDTGDPLPQGFDAVIMAEDLEFQGDGVMIRAAASPWSHVRPVGEDIVKGEMIVPSQHRIRPIDVGVLISGGLAEVEVVVNPRVAIFPTGTEMITLEETPQEGDIIESNSHMLAALVAEDGGLADRRPAIPDDYEQIKTALLAAVKDHEMVIINAGSSAGTEDYTVHVLREIGEVIIHGVAIKPGKPVILAIVQGVPVIGLPGYPVSAYIAYQNFVTPLLNRLTGLPPRSQQKTKAVVTRRLVSSLKYKEYVRVKVGAVDGKMIASPLARGAGSAMSLVRADGFCIIPQNSEGVEAGTEVEISLSRDLAQIDRTIVAVGSHDLILDLIADILPETHAGMELSSTHVGSLGGLMALGRGEAHLAPTHLLDEGTGAYNVEIIKELFPAGGIALIRGVGRTQGLILAPGNPLGIKSVADLPRVKYINRQRGAGTRVLLDHLLGQAGIESGGIEGYTREAATHMAVAAAVKSGSADVGMGILSAAQAMELDFIPIGAEAYDFAVAEKFLDHPLIKAFIEVLQSEGFRDEVAKLGGYSCKDIGKLVPIK